MIKLSFMKEKGLGATQEKKENFKIFMHDVSIYLSALCSCYVLFHDKNACLKRNPLRLISFSKNLIIELYTCSLILFGKPEVAGTIMKSLLYWVRVLLRNIISRIHF